MPDTPNASRVEEAHAALSLAETEWADSPRLFDDTRKLAAAELAFAAAVQRETIQKVRERMEAFRADPDNRALTVTTQFLFDARDARFLAALTEMEK